MQCLCDLPRGWLIGRKEPWKLAVKSWNKNHIPSENVDIFEQYGWFSALHDSYLSRKQVRSLEKHDKCRWQDKMFNILLWTRKVLCGSLLTRKVLCGSLLCAIYKFSFIHSSPPHPPTPKKNQFGQHVVTCNALDGLLLVSSPWGHPEWWTEAVYLWICVHFVLYFCLHRVGRFDFRKGLHRRGKSLQITITTVTIHFIHPNGKLKLSFDRTTKNIFQ